MHIRTISHPCVSRAGYAEDLIQIIGIFNAMIGVLDNALALIQDIANIIDGAIDTLKM